MTVWETQRNWRKQPSVSRFKFVWKSVHLSAILNHSVIIKMKSALRTAVAFRSLNVLLFPKADRNKLSNNVCFLQTSQISTSVISVFRVTWNHSHVTQVKLDGAKIHAGMIFFISIKYIYFSTFRLFSDFKEHRSPYSIRFTVLQYF